MNKPGLVCCAFGEIWCQRRDSNSQTPVSKTGCYSTSDTLALVHRGGVEPPRPTRGERVTADPFRPGSRTCANLAEGRRIERRWLITMHRFSGPVADHSAATSKRRIETQLAAPRLRGVRKPAQNCPPEYPVRIELLEPSLIAFRNL